MNALDRILTHLRGATDDLKAANEEITGEQRRWLDDFDGVAKGVTVIGAADQFAAEFGLTRQQAATIIYRYLWEHA